MGPNLVLSMVGTKYGFSLEKSGHDSFDLFDMIETDPKILILN